MRVTFWAYAPSHEDEHESSGLFAGFCGNANEHGVCVCHADCIAIDVVEMTTWNEAKRHGNYLGDFNADDGIHDPDEPLVGPSKAGKQDNPRPASKCCAGCGKLCVVEKGVELPFCDEHMKDEALVRAWWKLT